MGAVAKLDAGRTVVTPELTCIGAWRAHALAQSTHDILQQIH